MPLYSTYNSSIGKRVQHTKSNANLHTSPSSFPHAVNTWTIDTWVATAETTLIFLSGCSFRSSSQSYPLRVTLYMFYQFSRPESKFNKFELCLKSVQNRFRLSAAGLNLETLNTILSGINHI